MSADCVIAFSKDEVRALEDAARHLLAGPQGAWPGPERDARARVSAAMKLLRECHAFLGLKFIDFRQMAPFATRVIVEALAGPSTRPAAAAAEKPARRRTRKRRTRRARVTPSAGSVSDAERLQLSVDEALAALDDDGDPK